MYISGQYILFMATTLFYIIISWREKRNILPPGKLINIGDRKEHIWVKGRGKTTVVLDQMPIIFIRRLEE